MAATEWRLTRSVIVPSAMSWIFASLHVSFGFAIAGAIVAEHLMSLLEQRIAKWRPGPLQESE